MDRNELRAAILGSDDLPREAVDVPWELGGQKLYVRGMSANEKDAWMIRHMPDGETFRWNENGTAELVAKCLVTETGERIFTDDDVEALGQKDGKIIGELHKIAMRLSGTDVAEEEAVEEGFVDAQSKLSATS